MIKRPTFPVYRAPAPVSPRSFDHRLTIGTFVLAILVAVALIVRAASPGTDTPTDPIGTESAP